MAKVPTVRVADDAAPDGYVIINEADYDPDEHTLWGEDGDDADPLLEENVGDLKDALPGIEDADRLEALLEAEDRVTAVEAIEDRIEEIEG